MSKKKSAPAPDSSFEGESRISPPEPNALRILPLGGLGEIGMNCLVLEWNDEMVLIDCGIQFPSAAYAGVDLLTPDLSYVKHRIDNLKGIVVTHGHDDHIGAIPFLARERDLDVYCTPFPEGLLRHKLSEFKNAQEVRFHKIKPRESFTVGPFTFDPIPVSHSIIESVAFAIQTPVGNLVHTGDFKHDANEVNGEVIGFGPFEEWARNQGILLLLSDSTNAERTGHTLSELDIARSFETLLSGQTGRILIALFASNIRRVETLLWTAKKLGKRVAFAGRSMHSYTKLAHDQNSLNIPPDTLCLLENLSQYPEKDVIVLLTGSQAEPQSALVRISQNTNKDFQIRSGDRVILSSRFIPGNERNITTMIDHLYRLGAEVTYESIHHIHVSGHGFQDELLMMLKAVKPKFFVPIHGEYRHLAKHAKLAKENGVDAKNVFIIEDGQILDVTAEGVRLGPRLEMQKGVVVEGDYMEGTPAVFTQRSNLAKTGIVFTVLLRDPHTLKLVAPPAISSYGLLFKEGVDPESTIEEAEDLVSEIYPSIAKRGDVEEVLKLELRRFFRKRVSHKPVVIPLVLDN